MVTMTDETIQKLTERLQLQDARITVLERQIQARDETIAAMRGELVKQRMEPDYLIPTP